MSDKTMIADPNAFADERMRLDTAMPANMAVALDLDERTYKTVIADAAPVKVHRQHDARLYAEYDIFGNPG